MQLRNNLVIQFSTASLLIMMLLAAGLSLMLDARLDTVLQLLRLHGAEMMSGTMIKDADPYSIPSLSPNPPKEGVGLAS